MPQMEEPIATAAVKTQILHMNFFSLSVNVRAVNVLELEKRKGADVLPQRPLSDSLRAAGLFVHALFVLLLLIGLVLTRFSEYQPLCIVTLQLLQVLPTRSTVTTA